MRLFAVWLVALVALPFTAPFASFDLADLLAAPHKPKATETVTINGVCSPQDDDADDAAASDACVQRISPATAFALAPVVSPFAGADLTGGAHRILPLAAVQPASSVSSLTTTLRL